LIVDERSALIEAASAFGAPLSPESADRLLKLIDELLRWNKTYNLTAITRRDEVITHHLLDSLSVHTALEGKSVADVGTGAGFPGLPLAVVNPERAFTLIDSNNKKVRFVAHAARALGLANVAAVHARAEAGVRALPGGTGAAAAAATATAPFDAVVARAFAALPQLLQKVAPLCGPSTRVLAMKGKRPDAEIAAVPPTWRVIETRPLIVPGLNAERCVVILAQAVRP